MFKIQYLITVLLCSLFLQAQAQEVKKINFHVMDDDYAAVSFATIKAILKSDTTQQLSATADSVGNAFLLLKINATYIIRISAISHHPFSKEIVVEKEADNFSFLVEKSGAVLDNVIIKSSRPLMRQEDDVTIVDPENLVSSSTSSFEVLEKTPGLFIDPDGNIYISSMSPATVQINGRDMKMSAADMATLLKSLPPNAITRIEVVRTPSAKYDASSTGGVVNVVLKKGIRLGLTGSITVGMQQGKYGNQFLNLNLNNNKDDKSSFLNISYNRRNSYERLITDRLFATDTMLSQNAYTKYPADGWFGSYSFLFPITKKWDFDIGTTLSYNDSRTSSSNTNIIEKISTGNELTNNLNEVWNKGNSLNHTLSFEAKHKIDSIGSEWRTDLFYNYTKNKAAQNFNNHFLPSMIETGGDGVSDNKRNFAHLQSDLKLKLEQRLTIEAGIKTTWLQFNNDALYYNEQPIGNRFKDDNRTNTFHYNENINSLYVQGSKTIGKDIVIKTGARLENTNMNGQQIIPGDTSFSINRTDLFPYIYLSKGLAKIAGFDMRAYLVYRRTINRPSYSQLNPFQRYVDEFLSEGGNPTLRPQFNNNYEANISIDERPILAVGYNDTKDIFTNVIYQSDTSMRNAYRTYDNIGTNKEWYFRALGAIPPGGRYFFVAGAQYNHNFYEGVYENKPTSFKRGTWTFFTYQTLRLDGKSTLALMGFVRLKGQQQFYELSEFGSLNLNVNRRLLKDKLILTLSVNDLFFTNKNHFTIQQGTVNATGFREGDTRRVGINLRYNFGIRKKDEKSNALDIDPPIN